MVSAIYDRPMLTAAFTSPVVLPFRQNSTIKSSLPCLATKPTPTRRYVTDTTTRCSLTTPPTPPKDSQLQPTQTTPAITVKRPPPPLQPPKYVTNNPLTSSLYNMFSRQGSKQSIEELCRHLSADLQWNMPLFDARSKKEVYDAWKQFFSFAVDSTIVIYSIEYHNKEKEKDKDERIDRNIEDYSQSTKLFYTFEWTLSFLYPLPWRPRVSISGESTIQLNEKKKIVKIQDEWYVQPINLVRQALPKFKDILWLFPAPPSESDLGQRKTLLDKKKYQLIQQSPRSEMSIFFNVEKNERELLYVTPALPEYVFEGGLRRLEFYSTVTPMSIRYSGSEDEFECMIPLPSGHLGSANILVAQPLAENVTVHIKPKRIFAVYRFSGFSRRKETEGHVQEFIKLLRSDGFWEGDILPTDVWVRTYDNVVGFNSKGLLAITMYGNSIGVPRVNEIAIDITDTWEEKQKNR